MDIMRRWSDTWLIDFSGMSEVDAALYQAPFEHVAASVKPIRTGNREPRTAARWWLHRRSGEEIRRALSGLSRYLATPLVSRRRVFVWLPTAVVPDTRLVVVCHDGDATLGVLSSRFHEIWSLRNCSFHGVGNDPVYTPSTTFETFPFPDGLRPDIPAEAYVDDPQAQRIATVARRLNELREAWLNPPDLVVRVPEVVPGYPDRILPKDEECAKELKKRTLTNLYNQRPAWLDNVHKELDAAVAAAYGWSSDLSDDEILARLFELNQARAAVQGVDASPCAAMA
jgi:hypothetical protein